MICLDTSALIKLVIEEAESSALEHWLLLQQDTVATSVIGRVELLRVCRRIAPEGVASAELLLADLPSIPLSGWLVDVAENIGPPALRTLDALHLAAAFSMSDVLTAFVTYDKRLRDAALLTNLPVISPGAS
ncbi:MAG: type II toxin-antitoxin system VapC family toxin [Actinophytocola sp.]|uniref:type II toxin-antitoxin system VapC family toxin n=1 Tax=Actinophytocola sp. TaxID=1872138 RepID=UPI003C7247C2